jgi:hypothetical protein
LFVVQVNYGSGGLTYQYRPGKGTFTGKRTGSGWPTTVKAVPFGDLSGDRCNDVLVRFSSGALRAYRPACGAAADTAGCPELRVPGTPRPP